MTDAAGSSSKQQQQQQQQQQWSAWYVEAQDTFEDFAAFDPVAKALAGAAATTPQRAMSARQISGVLEGTAKAADGRWEEDWNDEDADDTFDRVAERCGLTRAS
jgi:poly(3-hydroxybutyrate) depolymerase